MNMKQESGKAGHLIFMKIDVSRKVQPFVLDDGDGLTLRDEPSSVAPRRTDSFHLFLVATVL